MRNLEQTNRRGFTLIELVLVVIILAILAGLVAPMIGGLSQISTPTGSKSQRRIVTETTMLAIRDIFLSSGTRTGLWADMGHVPYRLPRTLHQVFLTRTELLSLEPARAETPRFHPVTKIGWRGPYATQPTGTYPDITTIHRTPDIRWSDDNFTATYGDAGDSGFIDAWGNPIVLQIDFNIDNVITANEARAARLVSAGPNGTIDWAFDENLTSEDYATAYQNDLTDDVVVYLGIEP